MYYLCIFFCSFSIDDLNKCLEVVEKTRVEQEEAIMMLETTAIEVVTSTTKLDNAISQSNTALTNMETVSTSMETSINHEENSLKMVHNYWTYLQTCQKAVKKSIEEHSAIVHSEAEDEFSYDYQNYF